jgi:hypothetical protein
MKPLVPRRRTILARQWPCGRYTAWPLPGLSRLARIPSPVTKPRTDRNVPASDHLHAADWSALKTLMAGFFLGVVHHDAMGATRTTCRANHQKSVQPVAQKYSTFVLTQISRITPPVSPDRGALAIVTNVRWDAMDADGAIDVRAASVR